MMIPRYDKQPTDFYQEVVDRFLGVNHDEIYHSDLQVLRVRSHRGRKGKARVYAVR